MYNTVFFALSLYLSTLNLAALISMLCDKFFACTGRWRIPEKNLLALTVLGGSLGALLAMLLARHKIRKPAFFVGIPLCLAVHLFLLYFCGYLSALVR